jgi:hypothetical protein
LAEIVERAWAVDQFIETTIPDRGVTIAAALPAARLAADTQHSLSFSSIQAERHFGVRRNGQV